MVQKVFGKCETMNGTKARELCRAEQMDTQGYGKMLKRIQILVEGRVPAKEAKNWRIEGERKNYEKGVSEADKQFRDGMLNGANERFHGAKRLVEPCEGKNLEGKRRRR